MRVVVDSLVIRSALRIETCSNLSCFSLARHFLSGLNFAFGYPPDLVLRGELVPLMLEIPETLFDAQRILASQAERSREALAAIFRAFDPKSCIAAAGGMLTIPDFQANSVRLEAVCHLAVASASGTKKPTKQDASRWFTQVGQAVTLMEDAAEDVFVGRVHFEERNYLVLEGLFEANCHHLQHMLNVLEQIPNIESMLSFARRVGPYSCFRTEYVPEQASTHSSVALSISYQLCPWTSCRH